MATVLKATPVKGLDDSKAVNYDSDDYILRNTLVEEGKWRFYEDGEVIAEAEAWPTAEGRPPREILEQWASGVRRKTKRVLTQEDVDRKEKARQGRSVSEAILGPDGEPVGREPSVHSSDGGAVSSSDISGSEPKLEDDPDSFVESKIEKAKNRAKAIRIKKEELLEQVESLDQELLKAIAEQTKWEKMKDAISE